jgi:hypothetical protein
VSALSELVANQIAKRQNKVPVLDVAATHAEDHVDCPARLARMWGVAVHDEPPSRIAVPPTADDGCKKAPFVFRRRSIFALASGLAAEDSPALDRLDQAELPDVIR